MSYIQYIPTELLDTFIKYLTETTNMEDILSFTFDQEGNEIILISNMYRTYIINNENENLNISEMSVIEFIRWSVEEFNKNLDDWANFCNFENDPETFKKTKFEIQWKIEYIEKLLRNR